MAPGNLQCEDRRQTENFDEESKTVTKKRKRVETESLVGSKKRRLNNDNSSEISIEPAMKFHNIHRLTVMSGDDPNSETFHEDYQENNFPIFEIRGRPSEPRPKNMFSQEPDISEGEI